MQRNETIKKLLSDNPYKRSRRKGLTKFGKWALVSENAMFMSPILLVVSLDIKALVLLFMLFSLVAIAYGLRFYKHISQPRKSILFWKRRAVFERCLGFWCLVLFSLLAISVNNASKMRQENLFENNQADRGQKHIKESNWRQRKENNAS